MVWCQHTDEKKGCAENYCALATTALLELTVVGARARIFCAFLLSVLLPSTKSEAEPKPKHRHVQAQLARRASSTPVVHVHV